ncbi:SAM-dependent methyltransferase [Caulobacter sp. CCUG 60055]|uniref:class I SAM-dependent methyltransferase n=1 Tax=Caulobacter sp. CCUG 60055 TaxID=2100090 RepID=UPI001FA7DF18|nr:class I SAM-dependent methyltransferase [Caulobacter sp. CCUG 60055]MBQ1543813.1 class I SAM-dependent methyltransferase [Caulobacteraceae bacterium]MCI3180725.1 SAM-dependent methyltransferase [Caulobacter sp. CCUG 60055]
MSADPQKLEAFMGKMVGDMGAAISAALVVVGDRLGLYRALAELGPATPAELAARAGAAERYVREWLAAQAASGYVDYDKAAGRFSMSPEQAMVFADEGGPAFMAGGFEILAAMFRDEPKITQAFRTGEGVGWHEHDGCLFRGTERFFRPGYNANLVSSWIPALEDVEGRLKAGARVADVGCGHGASTVVMAKAYPNSRFFGFDYHAPSIERARQAAEEAGVGDRVSFEVASAKDFPGRDYDMAAIFDALHDMGDPVGAARHIRESLGPDGVWMLVEPFAHDDMADNLNPVGRLFYSASTMICTPASLSQEVGLGLGAQAGEARLRQVTEQAGFTRFRRAAETPFNLVFDVRP